MEIDMSTLTVELFIHKARYCDGYETSTYDLSASGYVLLGSEFVTVQIPTADPLQAEIAMLEKAITKTKAESQVKVNDLEDRIQELKALEFKG